MIKLDTDDRVLKWASESVVVPYYDPVKQKMRRYFPDFLVMTKEEVSMIEIKPEKEMIIPRMGKKTKKRFVAEATTYMTNDAKWAAAEEFCKKKGWVFRKLNERDLGIKPRSS